MDALTHAVEAYVSTAANPITDACALKAVTMISESLRKVVENGGDTAARENMAYAQFLAGMAFNNASLGYVHAMAHQLGGFITYLMVYVMQYYCLMFKLIISKQQQVV